MDWFSIGKLALGAFGAVQKSKAAKAQANASQTDLKKLRDDAQAAGFNPLTVLRATGGQGFNKGSSGALASATFWGNFANAGVSALNEFDPYNQKRKELDLQQAQASLANTMASTQLMKIQTVAPLASDQTSGPGGYGSAPQVMDVVKKLDTPVVPDGGKIPEEMYEQFPGFLGKKQLSASPIPSAAMIEEAYGDAASWIYGPVKMIADVYTTGVLNGATSYAESGRKYGFNNPARSKREGSLKIKVGPDDPSFMQQLRERIGQAKSGQLSRQNFELMGK